MNWERILEPIFYVLRNHKKTMLLSLASAGVFTILLFPYGDLSDLITEKIAESSQNQIFLRFDDLGVGILPPSIKMSNVSVASSFLPTLKAGALYLAPSVTGFLTFKPGFSASIDEVMDGDIHLTYRSGKKVSDRVQMQQVLLELSKIDLKNFSQFASLPVALEGSMNTDLDAQLDPTFIEQPFGDLALHIKKFRLPSSTVPTPIGPTALPSTEFSNIRIKSRLNSGDLVIEEGQFGSSSEPVNGRFKGHVNLRFNRQGSQLVPQWGSYQFKIDFSFNRGAEKDFGIFLSLLDNYKTVTGSGSRYALTLTGNSFYEPPTMTPLGSY